MPATKPTESGKPSLKELTGKAHQQDCIALMASMRAKTVQMVFADPPFNLNKKYNSYNDNLELDEYLDWTRQWLQAAQRVLKDDGSLFLYNIPKMLTYTVPFLNEIMEFRHWIAWNSHGKPLGKTLQPAHYGILYYTKTRESKFYDVRAPHARCRKCNEYVKDYGGKKHLRHPFGYQLSDVWNDIHRVRHNKRRIDNHPCQLPPHLIERLMLMATDPGDVVLDLFAGGGSAAIAAKQLGRRYVGCDIDPDYVNATNRRYEEAQPTQLESGHYASKHLGKIISIRDKDIATA